MIVTLAGGVGGAKMAHGLAMALAPDALTVIVNTGDDFDHYSLRICPDLDTVFYTLAGLANETTGWGVANDTSAALDMLRHYGEEGWFWLGDRDLATSLLRTERLRSGAPLSAVMRALTEAVGVRVRLLPMSDSPVATIIQTPNGELAFQDYFVRRRHQDVVTGVRFDGIQRAQPLPEALAALAQAEAIILSPSNPLLSIEPILRVGGMRAAIGAAAAPVVAVSPIIGGQALKGPADRILAAQGFEVSPVGVARWYGDLLDGLVLDDTDAALALEVEALGVRPLVTRTIMRDHADRERLARETLDFAATLRRDAPSAAPREAP
ncbi:MAG TPA: 2-phospho-L-lactate transferase [Ktedonobacterales bacterium]|nr:2-phospho-L-lactate transferase [Ktedonobacterales bacterium]